MYPDACNDARWPAVDPVGENWTDKRVSEVTHAINSEPRKSLPNRAINRLLMRKAFGCQKFQIKNGAERTEHGEEIEYRVACEDVQTAA